MLQILIAPLLVTLAIAASLWPWTAVQHHRPTVRLLSTLIGTSALIVVLQLILGAFAILRPVPLMSSALGIAALSFVGFRFGGRRLVTWQPDRIARPTTIGLVLGVITACVYGWILWIGTLVPPYKWDALVYHLTDIFYVARTQTTDVYPLVHSSGVAIQFFFAKVGELHSTWVYLLSGAGAESYRATTYALIPLALTAAVATRAAAEGLGWRIALPWIVPGVLLTPGFVSQPLGLQVDVAFAAFVLASFAYAIWAEKEGRFAHAAFAALAGGLAFGVKVSFIYYFLPIALVLLSLRAWRMIARGGLLRAAGRIALLLIIFAVPCGYWYGRNAIRTGNPLWPVKVKVGDVTVFDGPNRVPRVPQITRWYVDSKAEWVGRPFRETYRGKPDYNGSGFGAMFAAGYAATLFMLILAVARRSWRTLRPLLALPLTGAIFVFLSPTGEPRYILAAVGFAVVSLAGLLEVVGRGAKSALGAEEEVHPRPPAVNRAPLWVAETAVTAALLFGALGSIVYTAPRLDKVLSKWRDGNWSPNDYYSIRYGPAGEAFNWITDHGGPDVTFTFTNSAFIAPVLGWHNQNRVVQAATTGEMYGIEAKEVANYDEWRAFLSTNKVDYVVQWVPWWGDESNRLTEQWIADHPDDFTLVDDFGGRVNIFQPDPEAMRRPPEPDAPADLSSLSDAGSWTLEYTSGVETSVRPDEADGARFSYTFTSPSDAYCDWRTVVSENDWTSYATLSFDLRAEPQPAYLKVYVKGPGGHGSMRFRIDLSNETNERRRIALVLREPERKDPGFELSAVGEVHLIFDNSTHEINPSGALTVSNFRLEPMDGPETSVDNPAAESSADRSQP